MRKHLDGILTAAPQTNLVCYGDFNDSKNEPAIQEVMGPKKSPLHMADLWARDERRRQVDALLARRPTSIRASTISSSARRFSAKSCSSKSRVYRSEYWNDASDHRAVFTTIVAGEQEMNYPARLRLLVGSQWPVVRGVWSGARTGLARR